MLRATVKNLLARKVRLVTTSLAVLLGVAFLAGTLVLTDTIGRTFDNLFADVNKGTDAYVREESELSSDFAEDRRRLPAELLATVSSVEGVQAAEGMIQGYAQIVDKDGDAMGNPAGGSPTFGGNWGRVDELNPFQLVAGRAPEADDEVVIDKASADDATYRVGDRATVLTKRGPTPVTVVGIAKFGDADSAAGASFVSFTDRAAQELVAQPGTYDAIAVVAEDSVSQDEVRTNIAAAVPPSIEVLTGEEITKENQSDVKEGLSFFSRFLSTFALIALFVGAFIIYNTFSIVVAQRGREMALFRALGASRRQVLGSVLLEAVIVGFIASVLGLIIGIGVASGLKALLSAAGIDIPSGGTVVAPRTVVVSLLVGLVVSVVSAFFPARRASKVAPVAAMRDVALDTSGRSRVRLGIGVVIVALGAALLLSGLLGGGDNALAAVGAGAVAVFIGVAVLGPVIARPASRIIGAPLPRLRGMAGTLARENAMRNPKRTSATAAALMIGVGLVATITILASSTKESVNKTIDQSLAGDYIVDSGLFGGDGGLSPDLARDVAALPEVEAAVPLRAGPAAVDGSTTFLIAMDTTTLGDVFDLQVTGGSLDDLQDRQIAVRREVAEDKGLTLGDQVPVQFVDTGEQSLTVAAIFDENQVGDWLVGLPVWEANVADQFDSQVFVKVADGVDPLEARPAIEAVTDRYPTANLQDRSEYKEAQAAQINQVLNLIYALLGLAVFIALLGIANTLALSIFERTRELGLLRAVGMSRRQVRSSVRWESVIIALLGTALGLIIGLFFGWAIVEALSDEGVDQFTVPVGSLVVVTVIAALAGVAAAVFPARRASRLDVLKAITTE